MTLEVVEPAPSRNVYEIKRLISSYLPIKRHPHTVLSKVPSMGSVSSGSFLYFFFIDFETIRPSSSHIEPFRGIFFFNRMTLGVYLENQTSFFFFKHTPLPPGEC